MSDRLRTWAEVNLDSLGFNYYNIRKHVGSGTKIMSVIKSNGYGHGCLEIARKLLQCGTDCFAVACGDEALVLRNNGITIPILILGYTPYDMTDELLNADITFTVFDIEFAKELSKRASCLNKIAKIHIKLDVGMGRIGFLYGYNEIDDKKTIIDIKEISKLKMLELEGIFTHFPCADEEKTELTYNQFSVFMKAISELENNGIVFKLKHCCNSAALIRFPEMHLDMVRPGIILYGCYPSEFCDNDTISLTPVMELKTKITHLKKLEKGHRISYGGIYETSGCCKIATLGIGYADGFSRKLSNCYEVLVNDAKVKIIGRICMDQCMIDVTNVNNIAVGQIVTVFGKDLSVDICSKLNGTINYETLCSIGMRVPRIYIDDNKVKYTVNYLSDKL